MAEGVPVTKIEPAFESVDACSLIEEMAARKGKTPKQLLMGIISGLDRIEAGEKGFRLKPVCELGLRSEEGDD